MPFAEYKNGKIFFTQRGKGRAVVLLHGFIESHEIWNDYAAELSKSYRVICIDLPGHGKSDCYGYVHTVEMMAECVKSVLTRLGLRKYVVAGHSMGGYVALAFAELFPENLRGYCLFNSHAADDPEEKKIDRNKAIKVVKRKPMILINEMIPNLFADKNIKPYTKEVLFITRIASQLTKRGIINCLEGMKARPDRQHILQKTKVPVLYIMGKKDPVMNFDTLSPQLMLSPKIIACVLDNAGHMGYIEAKEECLIALKKWLRECFFEG
jgi:pimeloyl-ACP methyl ester carboxylesterase